MPEQRCPGCNKLAGITTEDFAGRLSLFCQRCKAPFGDPLPLPRLRCACHRWLASGRVDIGAVRIMCPRCRVIVELARNGPLRLEPPHNERIKPRRLTDDELVGLVEDRWRLMRADRAWDRAEVAVGLRFDVFNRDGFRCVYCGHGPAQGALLEADHVIPRSAGGEDTLANLVTACTDCNRGKAAKSLTA